MASLISDSDIQKVRESTDIIDLISRRTPLKKRGRDFWGCCPFHHEKTPSFKVDPTTQLWHCFGCGEGGDAFTYLMKLDELSFVDAVMQLAQEANIQIERSGGKDSIPIGQKQKLKEICRATAEFYHNALNQDRSSQAQEARDYLGSRHLGSEVSKRWCIGFAPGLNKLYGHLSAKGFRPEDMVLANVVVAGRDGKLRDRFFNRVMFPINDASGDPIAFGGRVIGKGEPKYLNSQETPIFHKSQVLYGLDKAKASMASSGIAIVCEGYTDVIAMHEAGLTNSVATLGTALTISHVRALSRHAGKKIVYMFDGDEAGQRATERALQFIGQIYSPDSTHSNIQLCALSLPDNMDPAEFLESHSADELRELIDKAPTLIAYGIDRRLAGINVSNPEQKSRALNEALSILAPIKDTILAKEYAIKIASRLKLREQDVLSALSSFKVPSSRLYDDKQDAVVRRPPIEDASARRAISQDLLNRIRTESAYLSAIAQNPLSSIEYLSDLGQIKWSDPVHQKLAESISDTLSNDLEATAAQIVECASKSTPHASKVLTSFILPEDWSISQTLDFLHLELIVGDMENSISELKKELESSDNIASEQESFNKLVDMQEKLNEYREKESKLRESQ